MSALLETIKHFLDDETIRELGDQVGVDPDMTRRGLKVVMPLFVEALAERAGASDEDAKALDEALAQDHDGSLLDNLQDVLRRSAKGGGTMGDAGTAVADGLSVDPQTVNGDGIADHVFGDRRSTIENGISRASGMDVKHVNRLTAYQAPIVMNALGRLRSEQGLDAQGVKGLLDEACTEVAENLDKTQLTRILDGNGAADGEIASKVEAAGRELVSSGVEERLFNPGSSRHFKKR